MLENISSTEWRLLADTVLCVHILIAVFIVGGQLAILAGGLVGAQFVRNFKFRLTHLLLIVFVAGETLIGKLCPLTLLEQSLRQRAGQQIYSESFTQHWLAPLIFFDAPWWVFTALHSFGALIVVGSWWIVPPSKRNVRATPC